MNQTCRKCDKEINISYKKVYTIYSMICEECKKDCQECQKKLQKNSKTKDCTLCKLPIHEECIDKKEKTILCKGCKELQSKILQTTKTRRNKRIEKKGIEGKKEFKELSEIKMYIHGDEEYNEEIIIEEIEKEKIIKIEETKEIEVFEKKEYFAISEEYEGKKTKSKVKKESIFTDFEVLENEDLNHLNRFFIDDDVFKNYFYSFLNYLKFFFFIFKSLKGKFKKIIFYLKGK
jgi:hypothetical protein